MTERCNDFQLGITKSEFQAAITHNTVIVNKQQVASELTAEQVGYCTSVL